MFVIEIFIVVKYYFRNIFSYCVFSNKFIDNNGLFCFCFVRNFFIKSWCICECYICYVINYLSVDVCIRMENV